MYVCMNECMYFRAFLCVCIHARVVHVRVRVSMYIQASMHQIMSLYVCVYMYVCTCTCVQTFLLVYTCSLASTHIHADIQNHVHIHISASTYVLTCIYIHRYMHTYMQVGHFACVCTYCVCKYVCEGFKRPAVKILTSTRIHATSMHVYKRTYIHIHIHEHIQMGSIFGGGRLQTGVHGTQH
jgi:hypothetical protein